MLHELTERLHAWWIVRGAIRRLSRLDDRLLCDLGITRDQIGPFVRGELNEAPVERPGVAVAKLPIELRAELRRAAVACPAA